MVSPAVSALSLAVSFAAYVASARTRRRQDAAEKNSYLVLSLDLERTGENYLIAHTSLENRLTVDKEITAARLVVSPEDEDPWDTVDKLLVANKRVGLNNGHAAPREIATVPLEETLSDTERIFMPLDYYYDENYQVGNETLTYDVVIDVSKLRKDIWYGVRLLVVNEDQLHRLVHRAFVNSWPTGR